MQLAICFCLLLVVWVRGEKELLKRYEYLNLDSILKNPRSLNNYINCVLGRGVCTPQGLDLKDNIPLALRTSCTDCSELQKKFIRKSSKFIITHRPEDWELIVQKYDPKGVYREGFYKFLDSD
ncbi:hypothetical protein C0J52_25416 [Blattella germanica]|uniref:Chemosensory protein n=1 Tax=Blattella germanica TaxID=6973 RepID=A0A0X8DBJ4_BLAGE|nr:chemosensory protein [Blattella germanica]PSN33547.1 hypothetical protein C0J52_25416 [Blattella germanica]